MKTITLTDQTFDKTIRYASTPVLVEFTADWCEFCVMMEPVLDTLASESQGNFTVSKLNIDDNPDSTVKFGVRSIPTFILFKNEVAIERFSGAVPKHVILKKLQRLSA